MFSGTGALADYNLPEDCTGSPHQQLVCTPSPHHWPALSPPDTNEENKLALKRKADELAKGSGGIPFRLPALSSSPTGAGLGPGQPELAATPSQDLEPKATNQSDEQSEGLPSLQPEPEPAVMLTKHVKGRGAGATKKKQDPKHDGPAVQEPGLNADEAEAAAQAVDSGESALLEVSKSTALKDDCPAGAAEGDDATSGPKTFAGRYQPKTEGGSATWLARRALFHSEVPPEFQNTKLQLSFWKFCAGLVKEGSTEEAAAQEFVRRGFAASATG